MSLPIAAAARASARALWAVVRSRSGRLTLDQLRSDLSHETAAKIARLSGLVQEWRAGRFQPADPADAEAILGDLERIYLRHARLAGARFGTLARLIRLLSILGAARHALRASRGPAAPPLAAVERFAGLVAGLESESHVLIETLSSHYGARFGDLLGAAVEEVRRESGDAGSQGVSVVLEGARDGASTWVPRRDAGPWADVLRNLVRNAAQATEDKRRGAAAGSPLPDTVTVRVLPLPGRPGTAVEVLDEGVGMSAEALDTMWRAGRSSHGHAHGQGLTESKRAFIESRATLEVRSAVGVGTCVRIDLPHGDVPIRSPRLWATPPLIVPTLLVLTGAALGATLLFQRPIVTVEVKNSRIVRAFDDRGWMVWQRSMGEEVVANYRGNSITQLRRQDPPNEFVILQGSPPRGSEVILATRPTEGPGRLWRLDARGRTRWTRTLRWQPPRQPHTGNLICQFQVLTAWNRDSLQSLALNVRDGDWSSTSIQFITPGGDSLGAYYHPGQLEFFGSADVDGDGRKELVLLGKNNPVAEDRTFLPESPGDSVYVSCVVMLEPPDVNGQAYPYSTWAETPRAAEEAYLLIPPIRRSVDPVICTLHFGRSTAPGMGRTELVINDGRVYQLDAHLRPLSCGTGDRTLAASLAPTRAMGPLVYIHHGKRENIDLLIE